MGDYSRAKGRNRTERITLSRGERAMTDKEREQKLITVKLVITHQQHLQLLRAGGREEINLVVQKLRPGPIVLEVLDVVRDEQAEGRWQDSQANKLIESMLAHKLNAGGPA